MNVECTLNGEEMTLKGTESESLLNLLRRSGYTGTKRGCDTGDCGFCTVILDGDAVNACIVPAVRADGATIETIEGLGTQADLHPVQAAFVDNAALQCGFCIPGMVMRSKALLEDHPNPDEGTVREALSGNLCRCTGYEKIVEAVQQAGTEWPDVAADGGRAATEAEGSEVESPGEVEGEGGTG